VGNIDKEDAIIKSGMERVYTIALTLVPGIGSIGAKRILSRAGSAEAVFRLKRNELLGIPGVGSLLADRILDRSLIRRAEKELDSTRKKNIRCLFIQENGYPPSLKHCEDAPLVLYARGNPDIEGRKILSVVGTRRPTPYGMEQCRRLIRELGERHPELLVVSGLAYGIDHCAHKSALECGLPTFAVLGHGLDYLYPSVHRHTASRIEHSGALITDFPSGEKPEKANFIKRNRIIAGLSQATLVVESGVRGGALITADLANSYNRDVFAIPGRISDPASAGCNSLIKTHRAALVEDALDLEYQLGWIPASRAAGPAQRSLFRDLQPEEQAVLNVLESEGNSSVDLISFQSGMPVSRISGILLGLELSGLVSAMPGNCYGLVR
jgi:DNA processing protein